MKVTVLVAVYNAERFLPKCMDSLLGQTHRDLQIVCIDDASTDASWEILHRYAGLDNRIVLLRNDTNQGQAVARNKGLQVAEGDYVTMLDSDDWLAPDALEQACRVAAESSDNDCVLLDIVYHDEDTGREWEYEYRSRESSFSGEEAFALSLDWSIHGLYMVRREIHTAYPYDTTCRLYSDDNTTRLHYLHSRRVSRCNGVYYYRQHGSSATHRITPLRFQYLYANLSMKRTMSAEGVAGELMALYENHRWLNYVGMWVFYLNHRRRFTSQERTAILRDLHFLYGTIDFCRIDKGLKWKFGYSPLGGCYPLFRAEVFLYVRLRRCYYRMLSRPLPGE